MDANEIVSALRGLDELGITTSLGRESADLIESLQAENRALNECKDKLIVQNKRVIQAMGELQHRERAAVEDLRKAKQCEFCKWWDGVICEYTDTDDDGMPTCGYVWRGPKNMRRRIIP